MMNRLTQCIFCGSLFFSCLFFSAVIQAECKLQTLTPKGDEIHANELTIKLGVADDATRPTAWQGPLVFGYCSLDIGIIEQPLKLADGHFLYVPTYSGSLNTLYVVDLRACKIQWQSQTFSGALTISSKGLELDKRHIPLDEKCFPIAK